MKTLKTFTLLALLSGLLLLIGQWVGGRGGLITALVLAIGMNFFSYFFSDRLAISMARGKQVDASSAPQLYAMVSSLADRAGKPKPRVFVSPSPQLNAFASGRNPKHAVVCVNQGLLDALTPEELEGVIGHELQHVYNRDILIGSIAAMLATAITFLARFLMFFGGGRDERNANPIASIALVFLAPIAAMVIRAAVTRNRESLADETGVALTGNPLGLARALAKLERGSNDVNRLRAGGTPIETNENFSHLFITAPFGGRLMSKMFSTHPPIPERIKALEDEARAAGQLAPGQSIFEAL